MPLRGQMMVILRKVGQAVEQVGEKMFYMPESEVKCT